MTPYKSQIGRPTLELPSQNPQRPPHSLALGHPVRGRSSTTGDREAVRGNVTAEGETSWARESNRWGEGLGLSSSSCRPTGQRESSSPWEETRSSSSTSLMRISWQLGFPFTKGGRSWGWRKGSAQPVRRGSPPPAQLETGWGAEQAVPVWLYPVSWIKLLICGHASCLPPQNTAGGQAY